MEMTEQLKSVIMTRKTGGSHLELYNTERKNTTHDRDNIFLDKDFCEIFYSLTIFTYRLLFLLIVLYSPHVPFRLKSVALLLLVGNGCIASTTWLYSLHNMAV